MIAILGQLILIICSIVLFDIRLPSIPLAIILMAEIVFAVFANHLSSVRKVTQNELVFHLLFDSLFLAGLVYFSGGANNPFIYLLLLYVAIASFMLQRKRLIILVCIELILYSLLNIFQRPLELGESSPLASFHLHLVGMWVNFILTAILLAVFGLITRRSMLEQEKKLQLLREKNLQDEQVLGLGIMSANAAHELNTPMSTMAIVIDDIQSENISDEHKHDMELLQEQISRCKKIIGRLNDKSQHAQQQLSAQATNQVNVKIDNFKEQLQSLIERWLVYQPKVTILQTWSEDLELENYQISISLEQAITNLLDNAADASLENAQSEIEVSCYLRESNIVIDIKDKGLGLSTHTISKVGKRIQISHKQEGLGWGMFLSNVSIERVGGKVHISDYKDEKNAGCLTRITLPVGSVHASFSI